MRKNSVRKWLHAVLDFLPLLVIPIFAIYTRNENYNSNIEVQTIENVKVEHFNQLFNGNTINNSQNNVNFTFNDDNELLITGTSNNATPSWCIFYEYSFTNNHKYLISSIGDYSSTNTGNSQVRGLDTTWNNVFTLNQSNPYNFYTANTTSLKFAVGTASGVTYNMKVYFQIFDLTEMNLENITYSDFKSMFPNSFYDYSVDKSIIVPNQTITYSDTDVGSQFVYTLYNATDKYFNCTNLFNLEQVWNWVQLNLFGGNAPLMVYVVWQVIVYEFFMDLIFLLYSVFMFVIDFATNCIDRFTGRANKC